MTHSDWASKFKIKGTELRCINNRYCLYKISSIWDKEKNERVKIINEMIGRITESEGLILKGIKNQQKCKKYYKNQQQRNMELQSHCKK